MPPRWNREPDRNDPEYRQLDDRMTFATHFALFSACNSGLWFFHTIKYIDWNWTIYVTGIWGLILVTHGVYIFAIANYTPIAETNNSKNLGFQKKPKNQSNKSKSTK